MINLPNFLAIIRVLLAPLFFYLLLISNDAPFDIHKSWINYFATLIFTLACITDFFDGFIARNWKQTTKLGAIIDPLADKMLTLAGFLGLMVIGRADPWAIYLILIREFFITGFRVFMVSDGVEVAASMAGKVKTTFQMIAIGFLTMEWFGGTILLWVAVVLTLYSGMEYVLSYIRQTKDKFE